ncbi:hypothetical protein ACQP2F_39875 [Actinoplanes sp. CA-030573]|uniref:hypothetical protein n=1 Tax=Actinoplanes sp. CA-030573 TaxID=3239898 RepID=UPI003D8DB39E
MTATLAEPVATDLDRTAWRQLFVRCVAVPLAATAPLLSLVAGSDHRYNVYWHGALVQQHPLQIFGQNLETIPMYVDFGNFRPLGRMFEWAVDVGAYLFAEVTHLPVQVGLRLLSALAAALLTAAAVVFAEALTGRGRLFAAPPARSLALLPFAIGCCLCAAGGNSATVLFGGLYFGTAALVLAVAAWVCRAPRLGVLLIVAGAALAAFNEMAAIAPPLATAALLARDRLVLGVRPRLRPALLLWLGFLPVFVPMRIALFLACRDGGCYRNSDLKLGAGVLTALPNRLTAWLPPLQWGEALRNDAQPVSKVVLAVSLVVFAALAARLFAGLPRLPRLDRGQAAGLAAGAGALLVLGALLGSVNEQGQMAAAAGRWGVGWRDSGLTAAGGALLLTALPALVTRRFASRTALVALTLAGAGTAAVNQSFTQTSNRLPYATVTARIAAEVAQFDPSPAGQARRCDLLRQFDDIFRRTPYSRFASGELPGTHSATERMDLTASMATRQMYGRPFCR